MFLLNEKRYYPIHGSLLIEFVLIDPNLFSVTGQEQRTTLAELSQTAVHNLSRLYDILISEASGLSYASNHKCKS